MAIGSGRSAQVGFKNESAYGTYAAPTKFMLARGADVDPKGVTRAQGTGIQAGRHGDLAAHYVETSRGFGLKLTTDLLNKGLGLIWQALMGGTVTPVQQGATAAYLATFPLADPVGNSLTIQIGAPPSGGTVIAQNLLGCKAVGADIKVDVASGISSLDLEFDCRDLENSSALVSASYTSGVKPFHGKQLAVKAGTYGAEAALPGVKSVGISIKRALDTGRTYAGATGLKSEPLVNGATQIDLDISADFAALADFQSRALDASAQPSVIVELVGPLIASTYYETWRITVPCVNFEPAVQGFSGGGVLSRSWKASWKDDVTHQPTIETISADTAL